jgi:hypothetical protein
MNGLIEAGTPASIDRIRNKAFHQPLQQPEWHRLGTRAHKGVNNREGKVLDRKPPCENGHRCRHSHSPLAMDAALFAPRPNQVLLGPHEQLQRQPLHPRSALPQLRTKRKGRRSLPNPDCLLHKST